MSRLVTLTLALTCAIADAAPPSSPPRWSEFSLPTPPPSESIGTYFAGCLAGGVRLADEGPGWVSVRVSRNRRFGHPALVSYLERLGAELVAEGEPPFYVADLGQARGGPTPTDHSSHQIGLDADVWFWRAPQADALPLTPKQRERWTPPSLVVSIDRKRPDLDRTDPTQMSPSAIALLRRAALNPEVDRIFVNQAIKRELCRRYQATPEAEQAAMAEWLRRVRPAEGHTYHFHVRLGCPPNNADCRSQPAVADGPGCDFSSPDWARWRPKRAPQKPPAQAPKRAVTLPPPLPQRCESIRTAGLAPEPETRRKSEGRKTRGE